MGASGRGTPEEDRLCTHQPQVQVSLLAVLARQAEALLQQDDSGETMLDYLYAFYKQRSSTVKTDTLRDLSESVMCFLTSMLANELSDSATMRLMASPFSSG